MSFREGEVFDEMLSASDVLGFFFKRDLIGKQYNPRLKKTVEPDHPPLAFQFCDRLDIDGGSAAPK